MLRATAVVFVALVSARASTAGPYDDLLKHTPAHTNALVLIDVKGARASALGQREKWAEKAQQSEHGGLGFFPADAERVTVAAELNLTSMTRDFQVGCVQLRNLPNFNTLASREGGSVDRIGDQLAVLSPRDVYFTAFPGNVLSAIYPADRQYLARWMKADAAGKLPPLSAYLKSAVEASEKHTVVIALDLEDSIDPRVLRIGLEISPALAKNRKMLDDGIATFLSQVKGLTFTALVTDTVTGKVVIHFPPNVARYRSALKDLFLELMDGYGIAVSGMDKWEATFTEDTMTLSGPLSGDDLKRVVSLFAFPRPSAEADDLGKEPKDGPTAGATRRYLTAVSAVLADMKKVRDNPNYEKTATWHDKAAVQIEQLSRRNVDPVAVEAAYQAARGVRAIGASLRGVPIETSAAQSKAYLYTYSYPGWGGWWGGWRGLAFAPVEVQTNLNEVQAEISKAVANDQKRRLDTWTKIDQTMSEARRKLTDKYKTGF